MNEKTKGRTIDTIIKYIVIFMTIFVSFIVVKSIITGEFDVLGITVGIIFIFFLIFLKWMIRESEM